ncbi:MAG: radical SAM protein [bacterium]
MAFVPRVPFSSVLSITNRCNLKCAHCFASANEHLNGELSIFQWRGIIDDLHSCGVFRFTFSGGEPFARSDWRDLAEYVFSKPGTLRFNTNATLITDETAEYLRGTGRVNGFIVGLDGADAETHDALRSPGAFEGAIRGIEALRKVGYRPQGFCVITKLNIEKVEGILRLAKKLGLSCLTLTPMTASGRGKRNVAELTPSLDEKRALVDELNQLRSELGGLMDGTWCNVAKKVAEYRDRGPTNEGPVKCIQRCGAVNGGFAVRADGQLSPCEQGMDYPCGSLLERSFKDLWSNAERCTHIRKHWSTTLDEIEGCRDCEWRRDCNGGCPASAHSATGIWPSRDPSACYRELV